MYFNIVNLLFTFVYIDVFISCKSVNSKLELCGIVKYDAAKQICCKGSLYQKWAENMDCCGQSPYVNDKHICCEGQSVLTKSRQGEQCCGRHRLYVPGKDLCCNDMVHLNLYSSSAYCCGNMPVLKEGSQFCCDGVYYSYNSYPGEVVKCCGKNRYKTMYKSCCNGKVVPKQPDGSSCKVEPAFCGGIKYNPDKRFCCGTFLWPKVSEKMKCCGSSVYNPSKFHCCQGQSLVPRRRSGEKCCGKVRLYLLSEEICCGDSLYKRHTSSAYCCGNMAIQYPSFQLCCKGEFQAKTHPFERTECCGKKAYRPIKQLCCSSTIIAKTSTKTKCSY